MTRNTKLKHDNEQLLHTFLQTCKDIASYSRAAANMVV